ncbi:MAG: hypothetical protein OQJ97_05945 [Rhodospirillales bacterium]|nr:hypothetical protein [Rhodospirillales bacterium]
MGAIRSIRGGAKVLGFLIFCFGGAVPSLADDLELNTTLIEILDVQSVRTGVLNPGNILERRDIGNETALISTANWKGLTLRVRMADEFTRHKSTDEGGWSNDGDFDIQELVWEFDLPSQYRLSMGKLSEAWHVGYAFHPLGFFESELNRDDLSERFKRSEGLPTAVAGYIADDWDLTLAYSNDFENARDGFNKGLHQWGARVGMLMDSGMEASLVVQKPEKQDVGFGGSVVQVFGNDLEIHGSLFMRQGTRRPLHTAVKNNQLAFHTSDPYQEFRRDDGKWYPRSVLGLQWTSSNLINVVFEWGHDERGLDNDQWKQWKQQVRYHANGSTLGVPQSGVSGNLKYDAETLLSSGTRQDYLFLRLTKGGMDWTPEVSALVGAADGSAVWNARLAYTAATTWETEVYGRINSGNSGSEFSMGPDKGAIGLGFRYHF